MDILTTAANAILNGDESVRYIPLTPTKNSRQVLGNLTNKSTIITSPSETCVSSPFNALFKEKISSYSKGPVKTPGKRRKNSSKYGDENQAPSPKTPKNSVMRVKNQQSPVTPLSNLKLLTRIASMEEHIPSRKTLFDTASTNVKSKNNFRRCYSENIASISTTKVSSAKPKLKRFNTTCDIADVPSLSRSASFMQAVEGSRRDKSLGLLCERFLEHFPMEVSCLETPRRLIIDDVASILGTERRRIYDIVNILECLNMASRVQKNMYQWMGKLHLEATLSRLKALAQKWGIGPSLSSPIDHSLREMKNVNDCSDRAEARKDKSLGVLCQKFLMLFLTSASPHVLQLDTVLHLLLGKDGEDFDKLRTRGRRIYDIANVLISLQLMKKIPQSKSFMYIGPTVDAAQWNEDTFTGCQVKLRHSLLPPLNDLMTNSIPSPTESDLNADITPSDIIVPTVKKGKPRKLATEFIISTGMRKCASRSQSGEIQHRICESQGTARDPSSRAVRQATEAERVKFLQKHRSFNDIKSSPVEKKLPAMPAVCQTLNSPQTSRSPVLLHFSRLGSPRMALTFQNSRIFSPLPLTYKPSAMKLPQIKVKSNSPQVHVSIVDSNSSSISQSHDLKKPVFVIHKTFGPTHDGMKTKSDTDGVFKVYSRQSKDGKSLSLPANIGSENVSSLRDAKPNFSSGSSPSLNPIPSISFNTLTRSHYKTVIGGETKIPNLNLLSDVNNGAFRFIINTNKPQHEMSKAPTDTSNGLQERPGRSPSFVKIFQTSPDSSSTDSELESIFGDSFKFTRPINLSINKNVKL